jgi:methionyl-tRNA synthetase
MQTECEYAEGHKCLNREIAFDKTGQPTCPKADEMRNKEPSRKLCPDCGQAFKHGERCADCEMLNYLITKNPKAYIRVAEKKGLIEPKQQ